MKFKLLLLLLTGGICFLFHKLYTTERVEIQHISIITYEYSHPSLKMYYYLKKYAKMYNIPEEYAFAIAYHETRYQGPFHRDYNWSVTSTAGAVGPMQIIPKYGKIYAKKYLRRNITDQELKDDIELNIQISMLMMQDWFKMSRGDWKLAFGGYNTGKLLVNQYALNIYNKDYIWKKM
jgi:soluble lytic murein transglycosylase-like protein